MRIPLPVLLAIVCAPCFSTPTRAGDLYATGFETFAPGDDKLVGTDGWLGTTKTTAAGRSGVLDESTHAVIGLGNAAYLGGNTSVVQLSAPQINVRRAVTASTSGIDPVALGTEVIQVTALVGVKDSVAGTGTGLRDDFELFFMNGAGQVLGALQFDNTTLDSSSNPQQLIYRTQSSAGTTSLTYVTTGAYFLHDTIQSLLVRVNFRTNLWSAYLDTVPVFQDLPFYNGSASRNFAAAGFRMLFGRSTKIGNTYNCLGGTNYLLFDDFAIQADPPAPLAITSFDRGADGAVSLKWSAEAGYSYQIYRSPDLSTWTPLLPVPGTTSPIQITGPAEYTGSGTSPQEFYRIGRTSP